MPAGIGLVAAGALFSACAAASSTARLHSAAASQPRDGERADADADADAQPIEVWVDLSEPALATLGAAPSAAHSALRRRIDEQQDRVMAALRALGATESARTRTVRNALVVKLPIAALDKARAIDGVRAVRAVQHRHRMME
jgi:hypothetical protein